MEDKTLSPVLVVSRGDLGKPLRERRKSLRLTIDDVARQVGLSEAYVGMIERGVRAPSPDVAKTLLQALGWTVEVAPDTGVDMIARDPETGTPVAIEFKRSLVRDLSPEQIPMYLAAHTGKPEDPTAPPIAPRRAPQGWERLFGSVVKQLSNMNADELRLVEAYLAVMATDRDRVRRVLTPEERPSGRRVAAHIAVPTARNRRRRMAVGETVNPAEEPTVSADPQDRTAMRPRPKRR